MGAITIMFRAAQQKRHNRVLDVRKLILKGWNMDDLKAFCIKHYGVTKVTAEGYIDEAAAPYRKKHQEQENEPKT